MPDKKKKIEEKNTNKEKWEGEEDLLESLDELDKPVFIEDILPMEQNHYDDDFYQNW